MKRQWKGRTGIVLCMALLASVPVCRQVSAKTVKAVQTMQVYQASDFIDMNELTGWASIDGNGLESVTGGGNATPQIVTTLEELQSLAYGNTPRVIVISGTISTEEYTVNIGSNKTIVGMDKNATIYGGVEMNGVDNIIISNLNFHGTWSNSGPDDCIAARDTEHLWLNHLNVWDAKDGNLDLTLGSDYLTVSWCKFWYTTNANEHRLSNLVGSGTGHDDTDMDKLKITYHHNWFSDWVDQRMPRIMYGLGHVYNNYYTCSRNSYCIGVGSYASVLIEGNYFDTVNNPHQFMYESALPCYITARDNYYQNTNGKRSNGLGGGQNGYVIPFTQPPYEYVLNKATDIPALVSAQAGPQDVLLATQAPTAASSAKPKVTQLPVQTPKVKIFPTDKPNATDNPITYDEKTGIYTCHGTNSDGSNGAYSITNPFRGLYLNGRMADKPGVPAWQQGVSVSYWVNVPGDAVDSAVLNFNLRDDRQINNMDKLKYELCCAYATDHPDYLMGESVTYTGVNGKEYQVLENYGKNVCYNPSYPSTGCYYVDLYNGSVQVYAKDEAGQNTSRVIFLSYIGEGMYEKYGRKFDEPGGESSQIREAQIDGSFSIYASGSVGFREDNGTGLQMNYHLLNYGQLVPIQVTNQFYYWGNGGYNTLKNSTLKTAVMEKKNQWHFVVVVIQNDWVQFYMDGVAVDTPYLNWWGDPVFSQYVAGLSFNLGFGSAKSYMTTHPYAVNTNAMTLMDFITDEQTVLTIGGSGCAAGKLGQSGIKTPKGTQIQGMTFYAKPLDASEIDYDRIITSEQPLAGSADPSLPTPSHAPKPAVTPIPTASPTQVPVIPTKRPTPSPIESTSTPIPVVKETVNPTASTAPTNTPGGKMGDLDGNGKVELPDAKLALSAALGITRLSEEKLLLADYNKNQKADLTDAQEVLKAALGIS